jgi:hypothetical protein
MTKVQMQKMLEDIELVRIMIDGIDEMQFGKVPGALDKIAFILDAVIHRLVWDIEVAS